MPGMLATSPIKTDTFCPTQAAVTNPCLTLPAQQERAACQWGHVSASIMGRKI